MKSKKFKVTLLFFSLFYSLGAFAYQDNQLLPAVDDGHLVFQLGGFRNVAGKKHEIWLNNLLYTFTAFNVDNANANALVGLGYYTNTQNYGLYSLSFGINPFYLAKTTVHGYVTINNLFRSLAYQYDITNLPVYFIVKSNIYRYFQLCPLSLDVGIGPNFMKIFDYKETSLDGTPALNRFKGATVTNISATLGAGLEFQDIIEGAAIGIGYRLFLFGKGKLHPDNNSDITVSLSTGPVYANALVVTIIF